jgi:2Fe-2S ferredoxin
MARPVGVRDLGKMPTLFVTTRQGKALAIDGVPGSSLMHVLRDGGIDELRAVCGGCAACGTCHIFVVNESEVPLPPISKDESDMLSNSAHRRASSRLACQIEVNESLSGLQLIVAPEDE